MDELTTAFGTAISSIQTDVMGLIATALPVGLGVFGTVLAIKKGISFVRSLMGR